MVRSKSTELCMHAHRERSRDQRKVFTQLNVNEAREVLCVFKNRTIFIQS